MNDLQIVASDQHDISTWDFECIKANLESALSVYKSTSYTEELFLEVNDCANVPLKIMQLCFNRSQEENREIVIKLLDNLNASYDETADIDQLNRILFDYIAAEADKKGQYIMETWEELFESVMGS